STLTTASASAAMIRSRARNRIVAGLTVATAVVEARGDRRGTYHDEMSRLDWNKAARENRAREHGRVKWWAAPSAKHISSGGVPLRAQEFARRELRPANFLHDFARLSLEEQHSSEVWFDFSRRLDN